MSFVAAARGSHQTTRVLFALDARFLFGTPPERRRGIQGNAIDEAIKVRHDAARGDSHRYMRARRILLAFSLRLSNHSRYDHEKQLSDAM